MEEDLDTTMQFLATLLDADRLGPGEIDILVEYTIKGYFGNGADRVQILGDWYGVVQPLANVRVMNQTHIPGRRNTIRQNIVNWFLFRRF